MRLLFVLVLALVLDLLFGEPPRAIHPVVWMGKVISFLKKFALGSPKSSPSTGRGKMRQLIYGGFMVLFTVCIFATPVYFILLYVSRFSSIAYIVGGAMALKSAFAFRQLRHAVLEIKGLLAKDNLKGARNMMTALVSRETHGLGKTELASAAVESVAENISDSFVAPLFYFLVLGVPGAVAYRVINTCDAMIGYHGEYEYLGKFAAKLDDALNFIPARISGLLLVIAAYLSKENGRNAWRVMLLEHGKTESPNAGWPMGAMAGALRVRLEKAGSYSLGDVTNPLTPSLIVSGVKLTDVAALLWVLLCLIMEVAYFAFAT
ncbi:MAG: cobalamin biosynthesis protein [Dehalococcoidia bacterium]|nr:cobalamin biosynthesis protein [Dehalococcoidia bacterium]